MRRANYYLTAIGKQLALSSPSPEGIYFQRSQASTTIRAKRPFQTREEQIAEGKKWEELKEKSIPAKDYQG